MTKQTTLSKRIGDWKCNSGFFDKNGTWHKCTSTEYRRGTDGRRYCLLCGKRRMV